MHIHKYPTHELMQRRRADSIQLDSVPVVTRDDSTKFLEMSVSLGSMEDNTHDMLNKLKQKLKQISSSMQQPESVPVSAI